MEAALAPAAGGSLAALRLDGVELLRSAPAGSIDPLSMASFPLVPYANRIALGQFRFGGRDVQLPLNFGDHPHSIHGLGWSTAWALEEVTDAAALLVHRHEGGPGWPWAYQAEQRIAVMADAVEMLLTVRNAGDEAMPAGLGFHPYFLADEKTRLQFDATGLWLSTPDMLPEREVTADALGNWSAGGPVMDDWLIDNVYSGWSGSAMVSRGDGIRLVLTAGGAPWLHVYRPAHSHAFCLEPVSHMPDAINRPAGMDRIEPGGTKTLSMRIAIDKSDQTLPKPCKIA